MKKSIYALLVALTAISSPVFMKNNEDVSPKKRNPLAFEKGGAAAGSMNQLVSNASIALPILLKAVRVARDADTLLARYEKKKMKQDAFLNELKELLEQEDAINLISMLGVVKPILNEVLANKAAYDGDSTFLLDLAEEGNSNERISAASKAAQDLGQAKEFLKQLRALRRALRVNLKSRRRLLDKKVPNLSEEDADLLFN
jgi:hypothetical protein